MKKKLTLALLLLVFATTGASAVVTEGRFTDENNFDDWYKASAERMYDIGVIEGFPDGTFSGGQEVKRSELAVMLHRFESFMNEEVNLQIENRAASMTYKTLGAYEYLNDLEEQQGEDFNLKPEIAMAESDLSRLEEKPEVNTELYDFSAIENYTLPEGYTAYQMNLKELPHEGIFPTTIYLNYTGQRFNGDDIPHASDEWYGPFSNSGFGIYK